jgi:uncharacterized membrane protein
MNPPALKRTKGPLVASGVLLGAGLGGFVDGIVLHQILQWHNMLSSKIPPVDFVSTKINMVYDGFFHAGTWLLTMLGIALLWRALGREDVVRSTRVFVGSQLAGWGIFNVVEGIIDHHLLGLHHVHPGEGQLAWDVGFVVFGAVSIAIGAALIREPHRERRARPLVSSTRPGELEGAISER